ncbi:MAG: glycosyltransferase [Erythrobacter sp.]|uniref:glycosyltransferase n=1 Tax=Erythrobacter sp. TaxID=1042 RepID=UPI003C767DF9
MILVTVGMQLGFDRLIAAMDALARDLDEEVVAQTGKGTYTPRHMEARASIAPGEFEQLVTRSKVIVSHAGIGTVLTAQRMSRPIVLMPRRANLGEHRNDHQLATVDKLAMRSGIFVAMDESELAARIADGLAASDTASHPSPSVERLHRSLARFIETGRL